MDASDHDHDLSEADWSLLKLLVPGGLDRRGRPASDQRQFLNAVFWLMRTGSPWASLPPRYGSRRNAQVRYSRWREGGAWPTVMLAVLDRPGFEWLKEGVRQLRATRPDDDTETLLGILGIGGGRVQSGPAEPLYLVDPKADLRLKASHKGDSAAEGTEASNASSPDNVVGTNIASMFVRRGTRSRDTLGCRLTSRRGAKGGTYLACRQPRQPSRSIWLWR